MRLAFWIVLGAIFILAGLFLYLPPVFGLPFLGWYKDLLVVVRGTLPAAVILFGFIFLTIAK